MPISRGQDRREPDEQDGRPRPSPVMSSHTGWRVWYDSPKLRRRRLPRMQSRNCSGTSSVSSPKSARIWIDRACGTLRHGEQVGHQVAGATRNRKKLNTSTKASMMSNTDQLAAAVSVPSPFALSRSSTVRSPASQTNLQSGDGQRRGPGADSSPVFDRHHRHQRRRPGSVARVRPGQLGEDQRSEWADCCASPSKRSVRIAWRSGESRQRRRSRASSSR